VASRADVAERAMLRAIELSRLALSERGGPFGAVVVHGGAIVGEGRNLVRPACDPTAHAEIAAIRAAASALQRVDLRDCELFASCAPCPMCLGAVLWARIPVVWYANTTDDAKAIAFDDSSFYEDLRLAANAPHVTLNRVASPRLREQARAVFDQWFALPDREPY
jgi:guanine deaminase